MSMQKMVLLPRNSRFNITVYNSKGVYQCEVKIADRYKSGNTFIQVLELITGLKRYQRREYYRYSCTVPVFCRRLEEQEKELFISIDEWFKENLPEPEPCKNHEMAITFFKCESTEEMRSKLEPAIELLDKGLLQKKIILLHASEVCQTLISFTDLKTAQR